MRTNFGTQGTFQTHHRRGHGGRGACVPKATPCPQRPPWWRACVLKPALAPTFSILSSHFFSRCSSWQLLQEAPILSNAPVAAVKLPALAAVPACAASARASFASFTPSLDFFAVQ